MAGAGKGNAGRRLELPLRTVHSPEHWFSAVVPQQNHLGSFENYGCDVMVRF